MRIPFGNIIDTIDKVQWRVLPADIEMSEEEVKAILRTRIKKSANEVIGWIRNSVIEHDACGESSREALQYKVNNLIEAMKLYQQTINTKVIGDDQA